MELLKEFQKYTAYFHDGDVFDVYKKHHETIFWMESAQIPPDEIDHELVLTNFSTLRGQLHLVNVKCMFENDSPIDEIKKIYDVGDIYDFEINGATVLISITWKTHFNKKKQTTDMIEYKIESEKIYWRNMPTHNHPIRKSIDEYQSYFINGKIFELVQENNELRLIIESPPVSKETIENYGSAGQNTLKKELLLNWVTKIEINGLPCTSVESILEIGVIRRFSIEHHRVKIDIHWITVASGNPERPSLMSIDVECGAIDVRDLP